MFKTLSIAITLALSSTVVAQSSDREQQLGLANEVGVDQLIADQRRANKEALFAAAKAKVTEDEVGDVDSFGEDKIYLGVRQTTPVIIQADCTGSDPANERCIVPNPAPGSTVVDETGLGTIELPKKATNSLLCFTFTQFNTYAFSNPTAANALADMGLALTVQIENPTLIGLVDNDGNPFNGTLFQQPIPIFVSTEQTTLPPGAFEIERERVTRSCTGGLVSARSLRAQGLTDKEVKDFFKSPMTISFGVQGSVSLVDFAIFFGGIRIYGDD